MLSNFINCWVGSMGSDRRMLAKLLYAVVVVCADALATPTQTYSLTCNPEQSVFTAGF